MNSATSNGAATIQPYLFFDGKCEEALDFYKQALGAQVSFLMRFKDAPQGGPQSEGCVPAPENGNKVMHGEVRIGNTTLMVSDGECQGRAAFQGFSLSYIARDEAEANRVFSALGDGGQVQMPLGPTFFSSSFGMVADRFGVCWMVYVPPSDQKA